MLKTLGVVEVRPDSLQAASNLGRKLGGKPFLEWVVRRVTECQRLSGIVVLLSQEADKRQLAQLVPPDMSVEVAEGRDALAAVKSVVDRFSADSVVRICATSPFVDPVLIDSLVTLAEARSHYDYISYCSKSGNPMVLLPLGLSAEWFSSAALEKACREAKDKSERNDVTRYMYSHPEAFRIHFIPLPEELDRDDVRLKIDLEEDWEHTQVIYEALGSEDWDWQRIAGLLDHQPALRERMAVLNRKESAAY